MKMKTIDVSNIKNGEEFVDLFMNSGSSMILITGVEKNPVLRKIYEDELVPKFKIGDSVRFDRKQLEFDCVKNNEVWTVVGMEKIDNQYLYHVRNNTDRYEFFGYELEKV